MNKYILIINGSPRSGKGEFVKILREISDIPLFEYSSIDYIKQVARTKFLWDNKKDFKGRRLLATLKDISTEYNNLPFKKIVEKEEMISLKKDSFLYCIDAREPEEIQKLMDYYSDSLDKEEYLVYSVCIRREGVENKIQSNSADLNVHDYTYDYYISNDCEGNDWRDKFKENIKIFYKSLIN